MTAHRALTRILLTVLATAAPVGPGLAALKISSYYSPWNRTRPRRPVTRLIILHTTEGPKQGSLKKIHRNGEAHYFVDAAGNVYRVIDRRRIALHAGRSMWQGRTCLDNETLGIEVEGYHNRAITEAQYRALAELLAQLQRLYHVPDERVLTHCMVAYGAPNRWHSKSHRGRKRCGMLFARKSVRARLGLNAAPSADPDVLAGRLIEGDPYLAGVLYGNADEQTRAVARFTGPSAHVISAGRSAWDIARDRYDDADTRYLFPDGTQKAGNTVRDWRKIPPGTKVVLGGTQRENPHESVLEIGKHGATAREIAGDETDADTTIYLLADGRVRRGSELTQGELEALPSGTSMLVGYVHGGRITTGRSAYDVCGPRWQLASTFYRFPDGSLRPGDKVDETAIPEYALVFFRN